jgi:hypothetical protein
MMQIMMIDAAGCWRMMMTLMGRGMCRMMGRKSCCSRGQRWDGRLQFNGLLLLVAVGQPEIRRESKFVPK